MTIEDTGSDRRLSNLLIGACFLIFVMIVIGGLTRLTGSGLSMVEWRPITGWLPPFHPQDWQQLFESYQHSPEYLKINKGMTLEQFKNIFWLEYIHRLWGRLIGLYFFLPLITACRVSAFQSSYVPGLLGLWVLGGLQGALGWYMVKSGLIDDPHVSPYRLTAHFMLAVMSYALTLVMALRVRSYAILYDQPMTSLIGIVTLIGITLFYGVLVAGHHAGLIYNTFPLMGGKWIPSEIWFFNPWLINLVANPVTVQWLHRILASLTLLSVIFFILLNWSKAVTLSQRRGLIGMLIFVNLQFALGLVTLLCHVPLWSALLHQVCAVSLLSAVLFTWVASRRAFTPGNVFPSSHSKKAPPAVDK